MAYNPYYSNPYLPQQQGYFNNGAMPDMLNQQKMQYQQMPQQPMAMHTDPMLWVLGQTEAESYPVAPNNTVTLWDKNQPTIYIKSANAQGVPSIRVLDFTERIANAPKTPEKHDCKCGDKFVPKSELNAINERFEALWGEINKIEKEMEGLSNKKRETSPKTTKAEEK